MQIHWADYLLTLITHTATMTIITLSLMFLHFMQEELRQKLLKVTHNGNSKGVSSVSLKV